MLDTNGYSELVIHPAPINIFTIFILPFIIKKSLMKQAAENFGKFMYWIENIAYIFAFIVSELLFFPIIYSKITMNIFFATKCSRLIPILSFWLFLGPFSLIYSLGKDIFFYVKILCNFRDDEDK